MTRLFSDMNAAHERMLRNPVAFTDAIAGAIGKAERGAHRHKHQGIAMCVGIAREVCKDFELFEKLRSAACLQDDAKVQAATEDNYKKYVPFAVATRSFDGTEATENRIRVYGYATGYFVKKSIPVSRIADRIKAMDGIDGVYERVKEKKREARQPQGALEAAGSGNTKSRAPESDERELSARETSGASSECEPAARESSDVSGERLTVKAILDNYLLVKMPKEELERYRDGSARRGERRRLDVAYGGRDERDLKVWEYVYGRDVEADLVSHEDNDNEVDYEDEDEDAA